ncbi:MAG: energy transducer TonB [Nitrospinae bacterium]|nr:energy transducer TonB [Nitrospinota bacterium]MBL7020428.1 energy transducer TonB [Nitrospinaceae bacterium]
MTGLIFLSGEKPAPKQEMPSIKISHIFLKQKTTKPEKGDSKPLKTSQAFQPVPHHASTVSGKIPLSVKPSTPSTDNINADIQPAMMISNTIQRVLSSTAHVTRLPLTDGLSKPLIRVAANVSSHSRHSLSATHSHDEVTPRAFARESNSVTASPALTLQIAERWIPAPKTHPIQIASIPSDFVDDNSESVFQTTKNDMHPEGETGSSGQDIEAIRKGFSSRVWGRIVQAKYYPSVARKRGWEGEPVIEFKLGRNGDLLSSTIALPSPHKILNEAALDVIKNAVPYPRIPETLQVDSIRFKLPITFILDEP